MKYICIVLLIGLFAGCSSNSDSELGPGSEQPTFFGYVTDNEGNPVDLAGIEVNCNCGWVAHGCSDMRGYYEIYGGDHNKHRTQITAHKKGYIATGYFLDFCGPSPNRIDFELIPEEDL